MARLGQFRRDTMANWKRENPIIADGEFILIANDSNSPHSYDYWACGDGTTEFINLKFKAVKDGTGVQGITDELSELSGLAISSKGVKRAIDDLQTKKFDKANIAKELGTATDKVISQKIITDELSKKFDKVNVVQGLGAAPNQVVSQRVTTMAINKLSREISNKVTFAGIATPTTTPLNSIEGSIFYFATEAGKYNHFPINGENEYVNIDYGLSIIYNIDEHFWASEKLIDITQNLGNSETKVVSQKVITDELKKTINELQPMSEEDIDKIIEESYPPEEGEFPYEELKQKVEILQKKVEDNKINNSDTRQKLDLFINSSLTIEQVNDLLNDKTI